MKYATERFPAPVRPAGCRALVVFAVLVGLFLMHGMSASADAACAVPAASMAASVAGESDVIHAAADAGASPGVERSSVAAQDCACDHEMVACTPLTGRDTTALLGALLLAFAVIPALPLGPSSVPDTRARRARVPRESAAVLDLACVSRI
jgi:hypothetical protein